MPAATVVVGIDVGQEQVEIAVTPGDEHWTSTTTPAALGALLLRLETLEPHLVVLEASGGYERPVVAALVAAAIPVAIVNPRRVRAFARARGQHAKTDRLDALTIARFGAVMQPRPYAPRPATAERLRALVRRREQVVGLRSSERQRRRQLVATTPEVVALIDEVIALLSAQCRDLEQRIATLLDADPVWRELATRLTSVPGVGPVVAATVLASLPELGEATDKEIAALVGLAPYSRESGSWQGRRRIGGGRADVRRVLYLAVVSARVHNERIRPHYERLQAAGKPTKVVMVACARKLLTILNAMVATGTDWHRPPAQA